MRAREREKSMAPNSLIYLVLLLLLPITTSSFSSLILQPSRKELKTKEPYQKSGIQLPSNKIYPSRALQLSWRPRFFIYRGFLSDEECDYLISLGHQKEEKSIASVDDSPKDEIVARIEERISAWTFLPKENSASLKVMHVGLENDGETYTYYGNNSVPLLNEPIMATVILYLSNVSWGGQILFPEADLGTYLAENKIWSDCTKSSHTMRPTKGNAYLFFNLHPDASPDRSSYHARCPILDGEMLWAIKLFHVKAIGGVKDQLQTNNDDCTDEDDSCPKWAAIGECQRNPVFMVGSPDYYGTCRKSCNAC